ncbi:MAG: molybdopterin-binding protein [Eubacteriales bacterium]|nr:molybdopterin-binding protein [Eubacteriales bacterium]
MKDICGTVIAVNISERKGTEKREVDEIILKEDWGIENDAHAGKWHRQVSLLSYEKVEDFNKIGGAVGNGDFGENIVVSGIDFKTLPVGTRFYCNGVVLELTQIGKECHQHCTIYHRVGDCIMPREGVFTKVITGGVIRKGCRMFTKPPLTAAILTASDKGFAGEREDKTTAVVRTMLEENGYLVRETKILPDERDQLAAYMKHLADETDTRLLVTTGGTGFSERDVTPEATADVIEKAVPGIGETMRAQSLSITRRAMLSRATAGIRKRMLIVNLPGSPKAAGEDLSAVISELRHGIEILTGSASECART